MKRILIGLTAAALAAGSAQAGDFLASDSPPPLRSETFSAEPFVGYVSATTTEYVRDAKSGTKLSQLNWDATGLAVGGRIAFRPLDWITVRIRGWGLVSPDGKMHDHDWLAGYTNFKSYDLISVHPDTMAPTAWFADASVAFTYWQEADYGLTVSAGFRHYETKFDARGGFYQYTFPGYAPLVGHFTPGQSVGTYRQEWNTPYMGLGIAYAAGDWTFSGEIFGSPFVFAEAIDQHRLRNLTIKSDFDMSSMVGLNGGIEYRWTDTLSTVGRFEYQHFMEARGSARYTDLTTGAVTVNPRPGSGTEADTVLVSLGVKARL